MRFIPSRMSCRQLLYVIRHGERADHAYGHKWRQMHPTARSYDPPLTDEGKEQARELGVRLRNEVGAHAFIPGPL